MAGALEEGVLAQQRGVGAYLNLLMALTCLSLVLALLRVVDMRPKTEVVGEPSECHCIQWCSSEGPRQHET